MKKKQLNSKLNILRKFIKKSQLILIIAVTILLSTGGLIINIQSNDHSFNQSLQDTARLVSRIYSFTHNLNSEELTSYMDKVVKDLPDVDVISIVDEQNNRIYHTHHKLINTKYDGTHPDFALHSSNFFIENSTGPSGPQRRIYSAVYDENGNYRGFIMTIRLITSIHNVTYNTIVLFLIVTISAIIIELIICTTISKKIKRQFISFTEDFEGTKFLVDSMRANNHDFINKLHVILGLIQIGQYEKAQNYIEKISIIQRETVSAVMKAIDNASFAALLIGKIARASECNVRFILKEDIRYRNDDIDLPSEALVTITGNLINNALDAMNMSGAPSDKPKELTFGVFTNPGQMLMLVEDTGCGIPDSIKDKVFENGFSTKGTGRGVGLCHTKQLIESLGGTISFESQEGKGTCFMVTLNR